MGKIKNNGEEVRNGGKMGMSWKREREREG